MTESPVRARALRRTFQALSTRNYRLFFIGQAISVTGTWMQRVAQDWLILELGGGPLELSIGIGLQFAPVLLFGMWGGLVVDRANVRQLLLRTQAFLACLALALGLLTLSGLVTLWQVYALAFALGCASLVDNPGRHAFVTQMVSAASAANAVSLNSSINNAARLVGPALAGTIIGLTNTGVAFLCNAATFGAIIVALVLMDPSSLHPHVPAPRRRGQLSESLRYGLGNPALRTPLVATALISTFAQNFRVTLPLFAADVFGGDASSYGLLMSALGVGALGGALVCAHMARPSQRLVGMQALGFGIVLLGASVAPTYGLLVAVMLGVGAGNTSFNTTSQALVLLRSAPEMRGRVMALRTLFSQGVTPLGSVGMGWICEVSNPRVGIAVGAVAALLVAGLTMREPTGADR